MTAEEKITKFASLQGELQLVESDYKTEKDALKKKHETEMEEMETKYESRKKVLNNEMEEILGVSNNDAQNNDPRNTSQDSDPFEGITESHSEDSHGAETTKASNTNTN